MRRESAPYEFADYTMSLSNRLANRFCQLALKLYTPAWAVKSNLPRLAQESCSHPRIAVAESSAMATHKPQIN
jgi:hypothetical protein